MINKSRQKKRALKELGIYFAEHGMLNAREYREANNGPIRMMDIRRVFGNYGRMATAFRRYEPEFYKLATEGAHLVKTPEVVVPKIEAALQAAGKIKAAVKETKYEH